MSDAMPTKYRLGDILRLQLNPTNDDVRWFYDTKDNQWCDSGDGGEWIDGIIKVTTYEPRDWGDWPEDPIAIVYFTRPTDRILLRWTMPLEGNPQYPKEKLVGFPKPSKKTILKSCGCGADSIYGLNNMLHDYWCPKLEGLKWLGYDV